MIHMLRPSWSVQLTLKDKDVSNEMIHRVEDVRNLVKALRKEISKTDDENKSKELKAKERELDHLLEKKLREPLQGLLAQSQNTLENKVVHLTQWNDKPCLLQTDVVNLEPMLRNRWLGAPATILISATLSLPNKTFDLVAFPLGIPQKALEKNTEIFKSKFPYKENTMIYIQKGGGPMPKDGQRIPDSHIDKMFDIIMVTKGNALVLFTNIKETKESYERLSHRLRKSGCNPLYKDESGKFISTTNPVLFGTKGLYQGFNVPGKKLRNVILYRIPFYHHGSEPYLSRYASKFDHNVYQAEKLIKQAFGRLVRQEKDDGIFALLDTRMMRRYSGKTRERLLAFAEVIHKTHEVSEIEEFIRRRDSSQSPSNRACRKSTKEEAKNKFV